MHLHCARAERQVGHPLHLLELVGSPRLDSETKHEFAMVSPEHSISGEHVHAWFRFHGHLAGSNPAPWQRFFKHVSRDVGPEAHVSYYREK